MRALWVHGTLAVLGLVWAYTTWEDRGIKEKADTEVTVFECKPSKLGSIVFEDKKKIVRLQSKQVKGSPFFWFEATTKANDADKIKESKEQFAGNKDTEAYVNTVLPFRALRSLGKVQGETLKDIQLDKPDSKLQITCGGQTKSYAIGTTTYGAGDYYVRSSDGSGPVYLVPGAVIKDLQSANFKLMQRTVVSFDLKEVDRIRVQAAGKSRSLAQRDKGEPTAQWVDASAPDRKNELFGNWLSKLQQLSAQQYLPTSKEPGSDLTPPVQASTPVVTLTYLKDGGELDTLQLVKVTPAAGASTGANGAGDVQPQYYAKSDATDAWVRVTPSVAKQIEQDVDAVLSNKVVPSAGKAGKSAGPAAGPAPSPQSLPHTPASGPHGPHGRPGLPAGHP
jgi:hypothetical protein